LADLDIWLNGRLTATTRERSRVKRTIAYDPGVVAQYGNEVPLLSCSLPTPGPTEPAKTWAYLEGLLPEGQALDAMAARVRNARLTTRGEPEAVNDVLLLLAEYGRECAGAVVTVPHGDSYDPGAGTYRPLDADVLATIVRELPDHPLGTDPDRGIRMSLAGAQPKFLLARFDDGWYEPINGAASTHIVKPTTRWPNSAHNESLVMTIAKHIGLTPASTWVETMGDSAVFVAERYDRVVAGTQKVQRRHQEDMCQALGMRPAKKYEIGRPSQRMARLLREQTADPAAEVRKLFRQVAFRVIIGDADGHGKNYSVCLEDGNVTLSPLYDSLCTLAYPELLPTMGTPVGRQQNLACVDRSALLEEAAAMGITRSEADEILDDLGVGIEQAVEQLPSDATDGWESDKIIAIIAERIRRLRSGDALGDITSEAHHRQATLDQLSR
jgi:serine/threonine-protein kinase HipA